MCLAERSAPELETMATFQICKQRTILHLNDHHFSTTSPNNRDLTVSIRHLLFDISNIHLPQPVSFMGPSQVRIFILGLSVNDALILVGKMTFTPATSKPLLKL
jgi:hypothetical protein